MEDVITLDITTWNLIASFLIPLLVGLVTKQLASPGVKAVFLALLSAINGAVSAAIADQGVLSKEAAVAAVVSFVVSVATYYGFWKPTTIAPKVQEATADFGVG